MTKFDHIDANVISLAQRIAAAEHKPLFPALELTGFTATTAPLMAIGEAWRDGATPIDTSLGQAVYRTDTGSPLGIVGQRYAIAQNPDLQVAAAEACEAALPTHALQEIELQEFTSRGGAYTRFEYTFPGMGADIRQLSGASTQLKFRIGVINSFNGSGSIRAMAGAYDLVCTNGMVIGEFESSAFRHSAGFHPGKLRAFIEIEAQRYLERVRIWQRWALKEIHPADAREALELAGMSGRRVERMMEQLEIEAQSRGMTVWSLYSALTYYSSHNSDRFTVRNSAAADNVAETLDKREREVATVITSEAFLRLAA